MISGMALRSIASSTRSVPAEATRVAEPASSAAQRLAATLAKIEELRQPLTPGSFDLDDVDEVAQMILSRSSTAEALELAVPALRRAVLAEEIAELEARFRVEQAEVVDLRLRVSQAESEHRAARVALSIASKDWNDMEHRIADLNRMLAAKRLELQHSEQGDPHLRLHDPATTLTGWD
jgi:hypothetical protein